MAWVYAVVPSIPRTHVTVYGPEPVGAAVTDTASCEERPQSIMSVNGYVFGQPDIPFTVKVVAEVLVMAAAKVVGAAVEL
jgi:hypothetical protein